MRSGAKRLCGAVLSGGGAEWCGRSNARCRRKLTAGAGGLSLLSLGRWVVVGGWGPLIISSAPEMPQTRQLPTVRTPTAPPKLVGTHERPSRALTKLPPNGINASTNGVQVINRRI